ncbi:chaperonin GroEL [Lignipirellula cremea]|uniref:Chaperonin GroEL n=1 Tax=Lignipirellula cremea TaxID=2528010 RepID=A0A518DXV1_9BACT|nr:chaperonin GroEL [Lignipirellula cremea]QDU96677.1 60 kDa chaperonin [Lignipirellula cremea]
MAKQLLFDDNARHRMMQGIDKLAKAVATTMGPAGHNVIINKSFGGPTVTKDGVTVAKEIELDDRFENMGAKLVVEVAQKTSDLAGDGTTTATVLARAIFKEGLRNIVAGSNPTAIRRGIDKAVAAADEKLLSMAQRIEGDRKKVVDVAAISANNDRVIGELLAEVMQNVGRDGVVTVEEGKTAKTQVDYVDGMHFDKGFISPYFINRPAEMDVEMENALILIHEKKIGSIRDLLPILEKASGTGRPLLIIAEDIESEALTLLVVNQLRGVLKVCAVKAPGFGDRRKAMLQDIAILTGGTSISDDLGLQLENLSLDYLGSAAKVSVDKSGTTIIEGGGSREEIDNRVQQLRKQINDSDSEYDKEKYQERVAKLSGGVAVISVGAETEADMKQTKARIEDALHAARAALQEGILPGGGVALLRCRGAIEAIRKSAKGDEQVGVDIVLRALEAPLRQIAENAGKDGSVVADEIADQPENFGYDAHADKYADMYEAGVIDPVKVVRTALANAASIAGLLLTTDAMVSNYDSDDKAKRQIEGAVR